MRNIFCAALAAILFAVPQFSRAQGQTALGWTRIERSVRSSAWAGAGAASLTGGAYAAFANAAQLPFQATMGTVNAGLQLWEPTNEADKATHFSAGGGFRFGSFGVALGGAVQMGQPIGTFTPVDRLLAVGLSYAFLDRISLGVNFRYAAQPLTQEIQISGISLDVQVLGRINEELSALLGVGTLGPKVKGSAAEYSQPGYAKAAVAWHKALAPEHALELVLDADFNFDKTFGGTLGAEYAYSNLLFVRAGYRLASEKALIPSHLGLGIGLHFSGFRADVSYLTASPILGNTVNIGLGYSF